MPSADSIAVVIPVYTRASVVAEALDCVAGQTRRPARLIIIDDGSIDDTAPIVARWIREHPRLQCRLITQANAGVSAARHRGALEAGDCRWIAFLDSDDVWPADFLRRAAAALEGDPKAVAAHIDIQFTEMPTGAAIRFDQSRLRGSITRGLFDLGLNQALGVADPKTGPPPLPSAMLMRRDAYRRTGGFDPALRVRNDLDLNLRLSLLGDWIHCPGDPLIYRNNLPLIRGGAGQLTGGLKSSQQNLVLTRLLADFFTRHESIFGADRSAIRAKLILHLARLSLRCSFDRSPIAAREAVELAEGLAADQGAWPRLILALARMIGSLGSLRSKPENPMRRHVPPILPPRV